jgi:hypothetical protein
VRTYYLRDLAFYTVDEIVYTARVMPATQQPDTVTVDAYRLAAFVCLPRGYTDPNHPSGYHFPAIIDTGYPGVLAISRKHLRDWCGLGPTDLPQIGVARVNDKDATLRQSRLWLYRNLRHGIRADTRYEPRVLNAPQGIHVVNSEEYPPTPLLGMRAFEVPPLKFHVNYKKARAQLYESWL